MCRLCVAVCLSGVWHTSLHMLLGNCLLHSAPCFLVPGQHWYLHAGSCAQLCCVDLCHRCNASSLCVTPNAPVAAGKEALMLSQHSWRVAAAAAAPRVRNMCTCIEDLLHCTPYCTCSLEPANPAQRGTIQGRPVMMLGLQG